MEHFSQMWIVNNVMPDLIRHPVKMFCCKAALSNWILACARKTKKINCDYRNYYV